MAKRHTPRDNGVITIRKCLTISSPKAITIFMVDDIPLVVTGYSVTVLKYHTYLHMFVLRQTLQKFN